MTNGNGENMICVVGLGYVGLTLALTLSECGLEVCGVDVSEKVVDNLEQGQSHFYEKGLKEKIASQLGNGFKCSTLISEGQGCNIFIIAVGTRVGADEKPDFKELDSSALSIGSVLKKGDLIILRSTVPVGVTRNYVAPLLEKVSGLKVGTDFLLAFAPERTVEGDALNELKSLPQVIGGFDKASTDKAVALFRLFAPNIIVVDSLEEAELVKMVNNSYRDLVFSFANELALICDKFNIDTAKMIDAANFGYSRSNIPKPSPGVGGYCLTKDPYLLYYSAEQAGYAPQLATVSRKINRAMPEYIRRMIQEFFTKFQNKKDKPRVTLFGFAFKGNPPTSDTRFSPTLDLADLLLKQDNIDLYGHDFEVSAETIKGAGVLPEENIESAFKDKDCAVFMNNHPGYKDLPITSLLGQARKPILIVDPWKLFDRAVIERLGGVYYGNLGYRNFNV